MDNNINYVKSFQQIFFTVLFIALIIVFFFLFYLIYEWKNPRRHFRRTMSHTIEQDNNSNPRITRSDDTLRVNVNVDRRSGGRDRFVIRAELAAVLLHVQQLERHRNDREQTIRRLPVRSYETSMSSTECAICLEEFTGDDECRILPLCNHVYHTRCIDAWLMDELTCPICRTNVIARA